MAANQLAKIAAAVREVVDALAQARTLCATFEVSREPDKWGQFTSGPLNLAYPFDADPALLPSRLGVGRQSTLVLLDWAPREFATFDIEAPLTVQEVAQLIDTIFESTLGCAGRDYSVEVGIIELPPD